MSDYASFLERKRRTAAAVGPEVDPDAIHPSLFDFQRYLTAWALKRGRAAIFADAGLGKTRMQVEWARLIGVPTLIVAPLAVAQQTVREAAAIGVELRYARSQADAGPLTITNYEMVDRFDASAFGAVVLDESSILKNVTGPTRLNLTRQWSQTPYRLACSATPAPNDVAEMCNHAEFLGILSRGEMLAAYFVHDEDGWRLKGHATEALYAWMATWATALRRPLDLGFTDHDADYDLPSLLIADEIVDADIEAEGQLFATDLGGIGGRHEVRRSTMPERIARAAKLAVGNDDQWIIWCGLNDEARGVASLVPGAVNVEGNWSPEAKADAFLAFTEGRLRVLVTKCSIAGWGMNFQNCHRMAFLGLSDSYEAYYQSIRRCWRFGQSSPVDVHIIVSHLERQIVENVRRKEAEANTTTNALIRHCRARRSQ